MDGLLVPAKEKLTVTKNKEKVRVCIQVKALMIRDDHSLETALTAAHKLNPECPRRNIKNWWKQREELAQAPGEGFKVLTGRRGADYPLAEDATYILFYRERVLLGLPVDEEWLLHTMKRQLEKLEGWTRLETAEFGSNGWLHRFKKRYGVADLVRTNDQPVPVFDRLQQIKDFHAHLQAAAFSPHPYGPHPKYGSFHPATLFYMDQVR